MTNHPKCVALWLRGRKERREGSPCGRIARYRLRFSKSCVVECCRYHLFRIGKLLENHDIQYTYEKIRKPKAAKAAAGETPARGPIGLGFCVKKGRNQKRG